MIQTELRLNNLFNAEIGVVKVESILGSTFRVYCHSIDEECLADYSIDDISGIPLTPEWLVRMGFEDGTTENLKKVTSAILHRESNGTYLLYSGHNNLYVPLEFVHQLQNLFYALVGTELEIKE
jgi:hypothetical protein